MLSFTTSVGRFQVRVAAIVMQGDRVLLHRAPDDAFWALPGGRLEYGEDARTAVTRELAEELAVVATTGALRFVVENFFTYRDTPYHELGFYFDATLDPAAEILHARAEFPGREGDTELIFRWFPLGELEDAIVRPAFLVQALAQRNDRPLHVVQRDGVSLSVS